MNYISEVIKMPSVPADSTYQLLIAAFECDDISDLPSQIYGSYELMIGSKAHVIATNEWYCMQSDGTWVKQEESPFSDVYTKSEIDSMVDAQAGVDSAQDDDIAENYQAIKYITDNCIQKNVMPKVKRIGTSNSNAQPVYTIGGITFTVNSDGTITVSRATTGSSQAVYLYGDNAAITIDDFCTGEYEFSTGTTEPNFNIRLSQLDGGSYLYVNTNVLIPNRGSYSGINVSISVSASFSGTFTIKPMICSSILWRISEQYAPPV